MFGEPKERLRECVDYWLDHCGIDDRAVGVTIDDAFPGYQVRVKYTGDLSKFDDEKWDDFVDQIFMHDVPRGMRLIEKTDEDESGTGRAQMVAKFD